MVRSRMSRSMSRSMSRRQNRIWTSPNRLKLGESTLHSELRRFLDFQTLRICRGRVPFALEFGQVVFASVRPAGRTHISHFHSNGQPSVAKRRAKMDSIGSRYGDFEAEPYIWLGTVVLAGFGFCQGL